jgi:dihydrofolate reductase
VTIDIVAAVAANRVIGRSGGLPWHLPDDLAHFKRLTLGHPVVMGRRTFESIARPLSGRRNIVVSSSLPPTPDVEIVPTLDAALDLTSDFPGETFIVGGAQLYVDAIRYASYMHLTELDEAVDGDTFFPSFPHEQWQLIESLHHPRDERHAISFRFCTYKRV